jgi:methyl-accepting chemotaxis protein
MQSLAEGDGQKSLELDLGSEGYCSFYKVQGTPFYIIIKVPNSYLNSSALEIGYKINDVSIISIVVALILSIWVEKSISTPLKKLVAMTKETKQGNFTSTIDDKSHDEVGEAISNFNQAISNIKDLIHRVKLSCSEVLKSSSQISTSSEQAYLTADQIAVTLQELARGSTEQAHEAMQSVGYMNNLAEGINKVTANLYEITELIKRTEDITVAAISDVELLNNKALLTKSASIKIQEEINDLNRDMQEINNIIKVISQVSDQTNLLSLNATIEAARAGEAGRGFAVVAEEIKKLAEQTRASSKTIENMLREISEKTQKTVTEAGMAHNTIMDQIAAVDLTNKAFYNISDSMKEITVLMNNMESSVAEMHDQKIKTQLSLENISSVSEESAAISEEVSAATEEQRNSAQGLSNLSKEMNEIAINLEEAISLFKV